MKVNQELQEQVFLMDGSRKLPLHILKNEIILPVYNTPESEMLPAGCWQLLTEYHDITLSEELIPRLEDLSRNFLYQKERYAYLVNFYIDHDLHLYIQTQFMRHNASPKRFFRLSDEEGLKKKAKMAVTVAGLFVLRRCYGFFHLFCSSRNVLFLTENSNALKDNLKALYDRIDKTKYKVRVFAKDVFSDKRKSSMRLIKEVIYLALSHVVVVDNYTPLLTQLYLAKDVKLAQLWHAGLGFKALGYARFGRSESPHPYRSCHRRYTDVFVDRDDLIAVYSEVFGCDPANIKAFGMPRLDGYLEKENYLAAADRLYAENPALKNSRTILFAPTFRGRNHREATYEFSVLPPDKLYAFLQQNNFVMMIKMHPFVQERIEIPPDYRDRIFDYHDHDINELIYVSDIMMTDYSSCAYEFSLFDRPLIFFRYDKTLYEYERQVYTLDVFCQQQYEAVHFDEVLAILEQIKNDLPDDRFAGIQQGEPRNACNRILNELFEDI